jgi:CPA2 family monovalent cation:H+ antiporter-2
MKTSRFTSFFALAALIAAPLVFPSPTYAAIEDAEIGLSLQEFNLTGSYSTVAGQPTGSGAFSPSNAGPYIEGSCVPLLVDVTNNSSPAETGDLSFRVIYDFHGNSSSLTMGVRGFKGIITGLADPSSADNLNDFTYLNDFPAASAFSNSNGGITNATISGPYAGNDSGTSPLDVSDTVRHYNVTLSNVAPGVTVHFLACAELGLDAGDFPNPSMNLSAAAGTSAPVGPASISTAEILKLATLTIEKQVDGGTANPSNWTFHISPPISDTADFVIQPGTSTVTFVNVPPDTYTVTEKNGPADYSLTNASGDCSFGTQSATVDVTAGSEAPGFTCTLTNTDNLQSWADIGVIFLLFGLGLEFSFKKLIKIGPTASLTGIFSVAFMFCVGLLLGRILNWSTIDSFFLGGILSISSTTIILRALEECGFKTRKFANLVFGVLIVEDLVAILLMVALSTFSIQKEFFGWDLLLQVIKLLFFIVTWFVVGIFFLPTFIRSVRKYLSDELILIVSLALCFVMVLISSSVGLSTALGAFVMGSLLSETREAERIENIFKPVKNLFGAIFFVSVGITLSPNVFYEHGFLVLALSAVFIISKIAAISFGAIFSGQSLRHALQTGLSMAFIGEFSFIIAGLGLKLHVINDKLYPIAVGISVVTILTTPFLMKSSEKIISLTEKTLPTPILKTVENYSSNLQRVSIAPEWRKDLQFRILRLLANSLIVTSILLLSKNFLKTFVYSHIEARFWASFFWIALSFLVASPFLWAVAFGGVKVKSLNEIKKDIKTLNPLMVFAILRVFFALGLTWFFLYQFVSPLAGFITLIILIIIGFFLFYSNISPFYDVIEKNFLHNLKEREREKRLPNKNSSHLAPWDAHIAFVAVPEHSRWGGFTLVELKIREKFGVTIALIQRGGIELTAPGRDTRLFPNDHLGIIGTDDQITVFERFLSEKTESAHLAPTPSNYILRALFLPPGSSYVKNAIRESGLREKLKGLIVGIERQGKRILNPDSTLILQEGDLLWVVGDRIKIKEVENELKNNG